MNLLKQSSLLIDIGNTHTHVGWHDGKDWLRIDKFPTEALHKGDFSNLQCSFSSKAPPLWVAFCSVVPKASEVIRDYLSNQHLHLGFTELTHENPIKLGIEYPNPQTIGPDRIANAMAAAHYYGAPSVVVDFGTAVTFDVVNAKRQYVGGIIAPGVAVMTEYLHEKTALLPRIKIEEPSGVIGKNTQQAMQIGAVHGYRGLVRELIGELTDTLNAKDLPVVATGGYAKLIAGKIKSITAIRPNLTLEGLLLMAPEPHQST
ncbi:MAG: type III pantothenate kinase [Verrucomicrobia bacterium]|jgi:type III pantothenate kinase|nr:type III pantothenate kinase [Verrucomicrobiota bacterium]